jgi:hypothetical protein
MTNPVNSTDKHACRISRPVLAITGRWPASEPVGANEEALTKFELVLSLKTANALGLHVPDKLLALAEEVVEQDIYLPRCMSRCDASAVAALRLRGSA